MIDKKLLAKIRKLTDSPDWGVREDATKDIKAINDKFFLEYLPVRIKSDPDP